MVTIARILVLLSNNQDNLSIQGFIKKYCQETR